MKTVFILHERRNCQTQERSPSTERERERERERPSLSVTRGGLCLANYLASLSLSWDLECARRSQRRRCRTRRLSINPSIDRRSLQSPNRERGEGTKHWIIQRGDKKLHKRRLPNNLLSPDLLACKRKDSARQNAFRLQQHLRIN